MADNLNRRLLRARDTIDRAYAQPLDVPAVAAVAHLSPAHFSRCFRDTFGETPHRYLQRRRVERSMFLLRESGRTVTEVCLEVGFSSLGTFSRTFRAIVGHLRPGQGRGPRLPCRQTRPGEGQRRPDISTAPTWGCPTRPATRSGSSNRADPSDGL